MLARQTRFQTLRMQPLHRHLKIRIEEMPNQGVQYFQRKRNLNGPIFSIDVECVAIGKTHNPSDRYPASVAVVDSKGQVVFHGMIKIPENKKIESYLTPISGIRSKDYVNGNCRTLDETRALLKQKLPTDSILVGQNIQSDIEWLQLEQGLDFEDNIDLSEVFCGYKSKFRKITYHSLVHEANVILGTNVDPSLEHDPAKDAKYSVQLWQKASRDYQKKNIEKPHFLEENLKEHLQNSKLAFCSTGFFPPSREPGGKRVSNLICQFGCEMFIANRSLMLVV